jgi:hypothetical protein
MAKTAEVAARRPRTVDGRRRSNMISDLPPGTG